MVNNIILILLMVFAVIGAGLFAGAETGIYRISRLRLRLGVERKRPAFIILSKALGDSPALLVSTLLGTNLAYYLVTSIVTYILFRRFGAAHTAELFATFLVTPVLFVFSELIPKNLFFYRADFLMPAVAPVLFAFHKLFTWCGLTPLLKASSRVFGKVTGSKVPSKTALTAVGQPYIKALLQETQEEAILSPVQTDIINRLASISEVSIKSVMTPISKVKTADVNSDKPLLLQKLKKVPFTRLPVYEGGAANIVGFINIYEALGSAEQFGNLRQFVKPIPKLSADTIVTEAINIMQSEKQKIVLVTKVVSAGREKPIGIVTMKDLVEELLGELAEW